MKKLETIKDSRIFDLLKTHKVGDKIIFEKQPHIITKLNKKTKHVEIRQIK